MLLNGRQLAANRGQVIVACARCCRVAAPVLALLLTATAAVSDTDPHYAAGRSPETAIRFDIRGQALGDALYDYTSVTGFEILVPGDMLAQKQSAGVEGLLTPVEALRALLSGTGLAVRPTGSGAFTLVQVTPGVASARPRTPRYPQYSTALQAAVTTALCHFHRTQPGGYRVAARLWVGPSGAVTRVGFLGSTGEPERDAALASLLGRLVVGAAPPPDLPQPTTFVVLPRADGAAECRSRGAGEP